MQSKKKSNIINFFLILVGVIFINLIAINYFFRIDLTEEKRFSINPATKNLLENVNEVVYIEVYLAGEFPAGFKRLQSAIEETLDEFRIYNDNIQYEFIDPNDFDDDKSKNDFHKQLAEKGIQPTNLFAEEDGQKIQKIMFPGAIVRYKNKEIAVQLLSGNRGASADEQLNNSVEATEYNLADAIRKLNLSEKKKIAFTQGNGELSGMDIQDIVFELGQYYEVRGVDLKEVVNLDDFDMVIVAKPTERFSDTSLFKLDQYIVKGGNAMFLVDAMHVELDSIGEKGSFSLPYDLNLRDLFFKLGVRLNPDLIKDYYCGFLPMVTGYTGNQPQMQLMPWRYYPMVNKFGDHPISKNMGGMICKFTGSIDTVRAEGIRKSPLIFTSEYTRIVSSPARLSFKDAQLEVDPNTFVNGPQALGYLLEGSFQSMFKGRLPEATQKAFDYKEKDKPGKVIVFSDGDLIRNEISERTGKAHVLGYDKFLKRNFANKDLILNAIDYQMDDSGLIQARNKQVTLRPMDKVKIKESKALYQMVNVVVPILFIILFAILWAFIRKRKYERFA